MKKIIILILIWMALMPAKSFGGCAINICFKSEVECPKGEIEDMHHICRSCLDIHPIELGYCRDKEEVSRLCPNREFGECENISVISNPNCSDNEFMGDNGKCYSCDTPEEVKYECIGYEQFRKKCPTRPIIGCGFSVKECPEEFTLKDYRCVRKCPKDSNGDNIEDGCFDKTTGEKLIIVDE